MSTKSKIEETLKLEARFLKRSIKENLQTARNDLDEIERKLGEDIVWHDVDADNIFRSSLRLNQLITKLSILQSLVK